MQSIHAYYAQYSCPNSNLSYPPFDTHSCPQQSYTTKNHIYNLKHPPSTQPIKQLIACHLHYILTHYGYQTLFSQRSSSRSFALLLSSGFHFSIFLTKSKNNFFSSPSSCFSASSKFRFGTSAAPRQFPVARCINKTL